MADAALPNAAPPEPDPVGDVLLRIFRRHSYIEEVERYPELHVWIQDWRQVFKEAALVTNWSLDVRPIEQRFKKRCMQDAMDRVEANEVSGRWHTVCDVERNLRLLADYQGRASARVTKFTGRPDFDVNRVIWDAVKDQRTALLECVVVRFLAVLSKADQKMKKKGAALTVVGGIMTIMRHPPHSGLGSGSWPDGLWTPVIMHLFQNRHMQFTFKEVANPYEKTDSPTEPARAQHEAMGNFPIQAMREIARADSLLQLKAWLGRQGGNWTPNSEYMRSEWNDMDWAAYRPESVHMQAALLATFFCIRMNAVRCYKFLCSAAASVLCAAAHDDPDFSRCLERLAQNHLHVQGARFDNHAAERKTFTFNLPPATASMLRLLWGECGRKPALNRPDPAAWPHLRAQWVREYLWERVRRLVRARPYIWHWIEMKELRVMRAELRGGRVAMVGRDAQQARDEYAGDFGLEAEAPASAEGTSAGWPRDDDLVAELAALDQRQSQRAELARRWSSRIVDSDAEDSGAEQDGLEEPAAKKARVCVEPREE